MTASKSKSAKSSKPAAAPAKKAAPATAKKVKKPTTSAAEVLLAAPVTAEKVEKKVEAKPSAVKAEAKLAEKKAEAKPVEKKVEVAPAIVTEKPVRLISHAEFTELVRKEAYLRAQRRNFQNGSPFEDWVHAEAAVSGALAAQGARLA